MIHMHVFFSFEEKVISLAASLASTFLQGKTGSSIFSMRENISFICVVLDNNTSVKKLFRKKPTSLELPND